MVCATAAWDSSIHDSSHLNKATSPNDRVYLILKATVRLSHPATMDLMLRKRLAINVYKKQSIADRIKRKITRQDIPVATGVTYEIVSNIPKASEDPEKRETLALMAASGEDALTSDGETYIEKYTRGVSAVESILILDRLRQEVAVKELLAAQGRPLRKTSSVPNITHVMRVEPFPPKLENQFRADSACELSSQFASDSIDFKKRSSSSSCLLKESGSASSPVGSPFGLGPSLSGMTPQSTKLVKPMSTVLEEQSQREARVLPEQEISDNSSSETQTRRLSVKLDESEEEINEFDTYRCRNENELADKRNRNSDTPDSIGDIQPKVGTPSIMSSGYGSQILSTTPASSEDSISLHSVPEDLKDTESNLIITSENHAAEDVQFNNICNNNDSVEVNDPVKAVTDSYDLSTPADNNIGCGKDTKLPSWLSVGESVIISPYNKTGVVAYLGPTNFATGTWAGIELDTPTGKNDGVVNGVRYFECKPRYGIFVRPDKLVSDSRGRAIRTTKLNGSALSEINTKRTRTRHDGVSATEHLSQKTNNRLDSTLIGVHSSKARSRSRDPKSYTMTTTRNRK